jgi:hypothetical protein
MGDALIFQRTHDQLSAGLRLGLISHVQFS